MIYDTNLFSSYSAGRYRQMKDVAELRPWWRYRHSDAVAHPRKEHLAWNRKILHADDPWWKMHYPPNGWGCRCFVETLADRDLERMGIPKPPMNRGESMPHSGKDPETGLPLGVDKGWDYAPGARKDDLWSNIIRDKLVKWDPRLSAQTWEKIRDVLLPGLTAEFADWIKAVDPNAGGKAHGERRVVGVLTPTLLNELAQRGIIPKAADLSIEDHELQHLLRQHKQNNPKNIAVPRSEVERLPEHLAHPDAVLWDEEAAKKGEPTLLYVFTIPGETKRGKSVVRVDFPTWVKEDGMKMKRWLNTVRTGGMLETIDLKVPRYRPLEGAL